MEFTDLESTKPIIGIKFLACNTLLFDTTNKTFKLIFSTIIVNLYKKFVLVDKTRIQIRLLLVDKKKFKKK